MTTRAALNILGVDGTLVDATSLGVSEITTSRSGIGQYEIRGTLGMAPPPEGWGYVVNLVDSDKSVDITYVDEVLKVNITTDGEPADLLHSITLHVAVDALPPFIPPIVVPPVTDALTAAKAEFTARNTKAIAQIARIQDRINTIEYGITAGESSPEDEAEQVALQVVLKVWKSYKFSLGKVTGHATWPAAPIWPLEPATPDIPAAPGALATETQ